jgi:exodeoxyribonuclease V beta subunit
MSREINLFDAKLTGTHLIEANAGTGKTYTITALFVRMIVEEKLPLEEILVVTFTKAAVSDLKSKIYEKLLNIRDGFIAIKKGEEPPSDYFTSEYISRRQESSEEDLRYIKQAIRDFDQCSVFTIHGFCQRLLTENAFSGKIPYDTELTGRIEDILRRPIQDFWRKTVYKAPVDAIEHISKLTPERMEKFIREIEDNPSIEVIKPDEEIAYDTLSELNKKLEESFRQMSECYLKNRDELVKLMDNSAKDFPLDSKSYSKRFIPQSFEAFDRHTTSGNMIPDTKTQIIKRFTQSAINEKATKGDPIKHLFFELAEIWYTTQVNIEDFVNKLEASLKFKLYEYTRELLDEYKLKQNMQSYSDLIVRMQKSVCENHGNNQMVASLHKKFKAVLIDEFQDTDPHQYDIFNTAFGKYNKPFFMIGDPKQAIYSFRGADVYAYLKAKEGIEENTLTVNHRTDPDLVNAVNEFFKHENTFFIKEINYNKSEGKNKFRLMVNGNKFSPMTIWKCGKGYSKSQNIAEATANEIAYLLNSSDAGNAFLDDGKEKKRVKPSDIAVLTRVHKEGKMVKEALAELGVPAVVAGSSSVFASQECSELIHLLEAVIRPFSEKLIKTSLTSQIFSYSAEELIDITEKDEWNGITERFTTYNELLNLKGIAPMFFRLVSDINLYKSTASLENGERKLTNFMHLIELAQKHEAEKKTAPQDILRWIKEKYKEALESESNFSSSRPAEEDELKMESDENAVTITTIHKSKGLEYNIVFTPFIMYGKADVRGETKFHKDGKYFLDINRDEDSKGIAKDENMAEQLRLIYVALTRAKSVCFTAWNPPEKKSKDGLRSALDYLIFGFNEPEDALFTSNFQNQNINIVTLPDKGSSTYAPTEKDPELNVRTFDKKVSSPWMINSFSRLIHSSHTPKDTDQFNSVPVKEKEPAYKTIFNFPKGAKAGSCLHDCLENINMTTPKDEHIKDIVAENLQKYSFDKEFIPPVVKNIKTILNKELTDGVVLAGMNAEQYVPEMEFHMCTKNFRSRELADIFSSNGEREFAEYCGRLDFSAIQGFVNGFADLIFEQNGRYYILDWKSNHLGDSIEAYSDERMTESMLESHYYLQLYIYTTALHIHLENRMAGYDYDKHMGGGIYVFMRGVNSKGMEGIYFHRPKAETIRKMKELFIR